MLNLDTHILIDALEGTLKPSERRILAGDRWSISAIVLWELAKLAQLGRIEFDFDDRRIGRTLRQIHTWPLTAEVCRASCQLDFRGDPADELIAATGRRTASSTTCRWLPGIERFSGPGWCRWRVAEKPFGDAPNRSVKPLPLRSRHGQVAGGPMRRKGRERRLRFFDRGNTRCPICLEPFSREGVKKGREVTLEHAPPKTLGGVEMCLTCTSCNRSAGSSLDQAAALAHRIGEEQSAGHGVRVLLEVCGIKRTTYFRPEGFRGAGSSLARNPAAMQFLSELPGHDVVVAAEFRKGPGWDLSKGIAIRKIEPDWNQVHASWVRSAYLHGRFQLPGSA